MFRVMCGASGERERSGRQTRGDFVVIRSIVR